MYEETKSSIDWKGIFLKVIIAFLIVLIAVKGYNTLKGNNNKQIVNTTTSTTAESKSSSTFTANIEKLRDAGEQYYTTNKEKLPTSEGNTTMVTLNELINSGVITALSDEDGKTCDGESSYVTAVKEGEKTKIKANLVCGSASSYSLVYMGENDNQIKEDTKITTNSGYTTTNTTNKKTATNCSTSTCGTPSFSINNNVSQNVTINGDKKPSSSNNSSNNTNTPVKKYYTVSFDSNGGSRQYASQTVLKNDTAYNPGSTTRNGYTFEGWYLNGYRYDFSTPVTSNITLIARFTKDNYIDEDFEEDDYNNNILRTKTTSTSVYTMGWDAYDVNSVTINHTLQLPSTLSNVVAVRIKKIEYVKPINTPTLVNTYNSKHASTFFYASNGWESDNGKKSSLATISGATFRFDNSYKYVEDALMDGFDVSWTSRNISKSCSDPFTVRNGNDYAENICNYGIVYKVTWEYQYYS